MNETLTAENIAENVIIFRLTKYEERMSLEEILDLTRTCWKISLERAQKADLAFAVHKGVVKGVFVIEDWVPAHSTPNCIPKTDALIRMNRAAGRWEFIGKRAGDDLWNKYVDKNVSGLFKKGCQSPFIYVYK